MSKQWEHPARRAVWDEMVEVDRLMRYYGALENKMRRRDRFITISIPILGTISLLIEASLVPFIPQNVVWVPITLIIVSSFVPIVYRAGGRLTSVTVCHRRLGQIFSELKSTWLAVEQGSVNENETAETLSVLTGQVTEITAPMATVVTDTKLYSEKEKEADEYWRHEASSAESALSAT